MQISTQLSNYVILNHTGKTKREETPLCKIKNCQADGQRRVSFLLRSKVGLKPHLRRALRHSAPGSGRLRGGAGLDRQEDPIPEHDVLGRLY